MTIALTIVACIIAYLIGSFPSAFLVAKFRKGIDIRKVGSHNMGAMNTFYKIGFWWGMLVLLLDIGKGALAVAVGWWLTGSYHLQLAAGIAAVLGHSYPVFLNFKGGKGGATCIGILVYIMPWGVLIYPAIFGLLLLITKFPTLSYSIAFLSFPIIASLIYHDVIYIIFSLVLLIIPILRYLPRITEMKKGAGGGGWKHVALRKNLKDRL
jgi:acyl phosphate:glycerol-3-phosphate acyltransferase